MVIFLNNAYTKRIDELGRIVIPKQIREDFKINNFDELDIYIQEGNIVIKKNIGIFQFKEKFDKFLNFLIDRCKYKIIIFDKDKLISKNIMDYELLELNEFLADITSKSNNTILNFKNKFLFKDNIIVDSNYLGDILFISNEDIAAYISEFKSIKHIVLDFIR